MTDSHSYPDSGIGPDDCAEHMLLQARSKGVEWTNIYAAQLGDLAKYGCEVRALPQPAPVAQNENVALRAELNKALREIVDLRMPIGGVAQEASDCGVTVEREDLADMIDSWEDAANYKDDYLRKKHGDTEEIAKYRAKYLALPSTDRAAPEPGVCPECGYYAESGHRPSCRLRGVPLTSPQREGE